MFKRLVIAAAIVLLPAVVLADPATDQLGPQPNSDTGPSNSVSQLLQPASPTTSQSLQSADAIEGGIAGASPGSNLQTAGNQDQFKVFAGAGATDSAQTLPAGQSSYGWGTVALLAAIAVIGMWYENRHTPAA